MNIYFPKQTMLAFVFCVFGIQATSASEPSVKADEQGNSTQVEAEHDVRATVLFNEIYDIDVAEGHYKASIEIIMTWAGTEREYLSAIGNDVVHGKALEEVLEAIWHPEFIVANAEMPRVTHYKTLSVQNGKFELFERFDVDLSVDAEMRRYPLEIWTCFLSLPLFQEILIRCGGCRRKF